MVTQTMDKSVKPSKEKRRNSEKRKEKSRDAARCRRSRETEIFSDLANGLPLRQAVIAQLDKASVMRLVISYLKIQNLITTLPEKASPDRIYDPLFLKALEGFLVILSEDGDLIYLSENVNEYLGISQVDMMGNSIYEFSHPCDHEEIREVLSIKSPPESIMPKSFFVRLKCTLTSKGRNVNLKSATYKVIHCSGNVYSRLPLKSEENIKIACDKTADGPQRYLIAIGEPIPHPSNIEIPLDKQTFLSKHSLDMKFTYADEKMFEFFGYDPEDLMGKSVFDFYHAMDSDVVDRGLKTLFSKGQCETGRYRFLAKGGGYVWVLTQATVIYDNKGQKPNSVVCVNFVISGIENKNEVYSCSQLSGRRKIAKAEKIIKREAVATVSGETVPKVVTAKIFARKETVETPATRPTAVTSKIFSVILPKNRGKEENDVSGLGQPLPVTVTPTNSYFPVSPNTLSPVPENTPKPITRTLRPQLATSKIFGPRTEDMNKGFLMFSDDEPGLTMLKDEPEDLTHLAPTAGDACVPLDLPQLTHMFDDFLNENYCPLLNTDDLHSLSDSQSSCNSRRSGDPFFSYRDDSESAGSPSDLSARMQSPSFAKSPGSCSIPSLCSPEQSPILIEDDHMGSFMSLNLDSGSSDMDEDLCLKAPFIPVDEDLPLLITATDLIWGSDEDKLNVGPIDFADSWLPSNNDKNESSLVQLLLSDSDSHTFDRGTHNNVKMCDQERDAVHLSGALKLSVSRKNDVDLELTQQPKAFKRKEKLLNTTNHYSKSVSCVGLLGCDRATKRAHSGVPEKSAGKSKRTKNEREAAVAAAAVVTSNGGKSLERIPSQLLQHLMHMPRPKAKDRDEGVWLADGGGNSKLESFPPTSNPKAPAQSHSVLMNLLEKIPKENLPAVASILRQLSVVSSGPIGTRSFASAITISGREVLDAESKKEGRDEKENDDEERVLENEEKEDEENAMKRDKEMDRFWMSSSCFLLSPESTAIPSLVDLNQQDYDVNAPVGLDSSLLQGQDLLNALDIDGIVMSP